MNKSSVFNALANEKRLPPGDRPNAFADSYQLSADSRFSNASERFFIRHLSFVIRHWSEATSDRQTSLFLK